MRKRKVFCFVQFLPVNFLFLTMGVATIERWERAYPQSAA